MPSTTRARQPRVTSVHQHPTKHCTKCGEVKPLLAYKPYGPSRPGKLRAKCRRCCKVLPSTLAAKRRSDAKRWDRTNAAHRSELHAIENTLLVAWLKNMRCTKNKKHQGTLTAAWVLKWSTATHCPYTGLAFSRPGTRSGKSSCPRSPSLDRIDPGKGYTSENAQVVSYFANVAKNAWSEAEFKLLVQAAASHMRH